MTDFTDARQYAPATQRNREPILAVFQQILPPTGTILEISSGTGEHAVFFAPKLMPRSWLPSDVNPIARASIDAWRTYESVANVCPAIELDVCAPVWPVERNLSQEFGLQLEAITAIVNINMIHIAPWAACLGLMAGANRVLPSGGILYLYGPFKQAGQHTAESNAAFDASLRQQNPDWGVRDLEGVISEAEAQQLNFVQTIGMPANNLSVVFQRQ